MFYSHPQLVDELLEDMDLPIHRSGGNWLSWPFKVVDLKEVEKLHHEREEKKEKSWLGRTSLSVIYQYDPFLMNNIHICI